MPPQSPDARRLLADYLDDLQRRMGDGWARAGYVDAAPDELRPPAGALLLGYENDEPVACGAVHVISLGIAEIKRCSSCHVPRAAGWDEPCLKRSRAPRSSSAATSPRLDSTESLAEAMALYTSAGYTEIGDYNHNPNATVWMERRLRH